MKIASLIYSSHLTPGVSRSQIVELVEKAQIANAANGLTGMLVFENNMFLQRIEGEITQINRTFEKILKDSRHHSCKTIEINLDTVRLFENWSMQLTILADDPKIKLRLGDDFTFYPDFLDAMGANRLLKTLRNIRN